MITLYAFRRVHPGMIAEARDLRAQCALEESGLPYRVHALDYIAGGMGGEWACERRAALVKEAGRRALPGLECRLDGREWIARDAFAVADILLATGLRQVRNTDLIEPYPRLKAYYERALARPAWQRTLSLSAERQRATVADIH